MFRGYQLNFSRSLALAAAALALFFNVKNAGAQFQNAPTPLRVQIDSAIAKVKPALVRIRVVSTEYRDGREVKMQEVGSGAIITKDGYIITNHHVAGHAARMFCTLWDREEIEAELIGTDPLTDISIIKLKPAKPREFKFVNFGDSGRMRVGDSVLAMGSPMALSQSVTLGILSNTEMVMPRFWGGGGAFRLDGEDVGALVRWFAHDAAIYGGNSGGPLVNLRGDIIGINEISFGLSGAIPGNLAKSVATELMSKHHIERSWLGIDAQPLFKQSAEEHGILVSSIVESSPAAAAGLKPGDLLLRLGKTATDVHFDEQMPDFMWLVSTLPLGTNIKVVVKRDGQEITLPITPVERGQIFLKQHEVKAWGLVARDFSFLLAKEMKRTNLDGVLVTSVRPGGPAGESKPSIEAGDTIVEVNHKRVKSVGDLIEMSRKVTEGKSDRVPVIAVFERKADRYMTVVRVGIQDEKNPGLEVSKAWLPVETHVISREIAKLLEQPNLTGFYLTRVYPDSTAEKAGLKAGDFLVAVDDEKLTASGPEHEDELSTLIRQYDIGKKVELTVLRDGKQLKIPVELARSPRLEREMKKYRNDDFEFTARDICFFDTADEQWNGSQRGALVEEVKPGSWAELASLYPGDLILEVDGEPVTSVE
ncbi:MAG: Trypsin-like serine protease, typically periplasmic, containing C-terminal domain, partial [Pedosphaera sp.]|nr:Trypsin-like serine protease, typically periplasmic, containing C-terminal domain [Pedosphaera sp.]